ncbi:hypothetical protein [Pollutibacter soli]|uniref:hypothetical protein n=1 Tax=Pollutibacter soli TaxID=3034157 RepID=UPI0030137B5C
MKKGTTAHLLTYIVLILMVSGLYAYNIKSKCDDGTAVCKVKRPKEQDDIKLKVNVPLWQSLSRQLITIGK